MKGYNKLALAEAAAKRLIARGYGVTIECRKGWYVLHLTGAPFQLDPDNDNTPPTQRSA